MRLRFGIEFLYSTFHVGEQDVATILKTAFIQLQLIQLAGAVEYTDCRGVRPLTLCNECPGYDAKQSDSEAPVLEFWGIWSSSSLPLLLGPLWPRMVAPDRVLSMGLL